MPELRVRVPATSANLGPGFDSLGIALSLYNDFFVSLTDETLVVDSEPGTEGPENLFLQSYRRGMAELRVPVQPIRVRFASGVPMARGLGSSSTCIVGGLLAASAAAAGALDAPARGGGALPSALSRSRILDIAAEIEGHPDNVAPAVLGGFAVAVTEGGRVVAIRASIDEELRFHAMVPPFPLETAKARAALPASVTHKDAAFNAGRAALVAAAFLSRDYGALGVACCDRLHEPYRAPLIPGFAEVAEAARAQGALAVFLSGAGPTVMALCRAEDGGFPARMQATLAARVGGAWGLLSLRANDSGATVDRA
ncbi:MAG: homoserine kinase [Spirochaetaceae bacterium]|nr:homoserine kinase [Spirochaetaceae bacterium]